MPDIWSEVDALLGEPPLRPRQAATPSVWDEADELLATSGWPPAIKPRIEDLLGPMRPVSSHELTRAPSLVDRPAMPGNLDRQRAWSLSPARDRAAVRRGQPAAPPPVADRPLDPATEFYRRSTMGSTALGQFGTPPIAELDRPVLPPVSPRPRRSTIPLEPGFQAARAGETFAREVPHIAEGAAALANRIDRPRLPAAPAVRPRVPMEPGSRVADVAAEVARESATRGFAAGAVESLGALIEGQFSPVNLGLWALGLGSAKLATGVTAEVATATGLMDDILAAARQGADVAPMMSELREAASRIRMLEQLRRGTRAVQTGAGGALAVEGVETAADPDRTLAERLGGLATAAGGAALGVSGVKGVWEPHPAVQALHDRIYPPRGAPPMRNVTPTRAPAGRQIDEGLPPAKVGPEPVAPAPRGDVWKEADLLLQSTPANVAAEPLPPTGLTEQGLPSQVSAAAPVIAAKARVEELLERVQILDVALAEPTIEEVDRKIFRARKMRQEIEQRLQQHLQSRGGLSQTLGELGREQQNLKVIDEHLAALTDTRAEIAARGKREPPAAGETTHEFASTQITLPDDVGQALQEISRTIPDADLAADGRETAPHVTVKFGLHDNDPERVRQLLADEKPITLTLGKTSFFPNSESNAGDVVKVDIDSPALHRLNQKIADALPHTDTHPTYQPHATIAYVKPGLGKKYAGDATLEGKTITVDRIVFAGKNDEQIEISLGGQSARAVGSSSTSQLATLKDTADVEAIPGAPARQIQTRDPRARDAAAPSGEAPLRGGGRSLEGRRLSKTRQREADLLTKVTQDAVARGYTGDPEALYRALDERAQAMREIKAEVDAAGGTPQALLREIVKAGGISIKAESSQKGELRWLKESDLSTRWGLFTGKGKGLTLDGVVEYLRQDARFQHIKDINALVDELTDIAQSETRLGELTLRELGAIGDAWWEKIVPAPRSGVARLEDIVDVLETLEAQPRLPEAGQVRERETATPAMEAPFSLTGEAHDPGSLQTGFPFDRPRAPQTSAKPTGGGGGSEASVGAFGEQGSQEPVREGRVPKTEDRRLFPEAKETRATSVRPAQFPELVDLARRLQGVPKIVKQFRKPEKLGEFSERGIKLTAELFTPGNEYQLAATLAHEIGHLVDWLPHETLKHGNLLGRLYSLHHYLKHTFTADDGAIIENAIIRAELQALSDKWRPWNPEKSSASFRKYRHSGKELYADALSVLLNNPGLLEQKAPTFYTQFFAGLDRKPDVQRAYFDLQEVLAGTPEELVARRRQGVRRMFEEGDVKALELERRRQRDLARQSKDFWFRLKMQVVDRNYAVIDRVAKLPKEVVLSDDDNPIYLLEERNYLGGKLKAFTERSFAPIFKDVTAADIHWNAFGEALFYERILAGDRSELANPRGLSPETARELYDSLKSELGAEKVRVLEQAMPTFRAAVKQVAEEAWRAGLFTDELHAQMLENPAYVTFQVIDHLESGVTSRVYRQIGTLKDVVNPADATILKTLVTLRAIEHQKVKQATFKFLSRYYPEDIADAKTVSSGKSQRPVESRDPNQRLLTYYERGHLKGKYVDPYIADALNRESIGQNLAVVSILRHINSAIFRPVFTTFNLGFQSFNFARDFARFWKNVPGMTVGRALQRYWQAAPVAKVRAYGLPDAPTAKERQAYLDLLDAEEAKMLSVTFNDLITGREVEDTPIEDILSRVGVGGFQTARHSKFVRPIVAIFDAIRETGDFIETLPKAAALLEFKGAGSIANMPASKRSFLRRKVGSPDFLAGGTAKPITNEVLLFSNAITQAMRSDLEVATDPKTRSGFWWKTAKANLLPKLLLAAGLAGLLGETVRRLLERTTEYDRTNYIVVPLGEDANDNTVYLRVPQDDSGRLIGGLFWKMLRLARGDSDVVETVTQVADYTAGQLPSVSPTLEALSTTSQFVAGQNPYDWFRGRTVFTEDEWKARDWRAAKKFLGWEFQQLGGGIVWKFYPGEQRPRELTDGQKLLELPIVSNIVGRFIRITNYGDVERFRNVQGDVARTEARTRLTEREQVNAAIRIYQRLPPPEQTPGRRWQLAREIVNQVHAGESPQERTRRTSLIVKKLALGIVRGEADALGDSVLSAQSNDQKVAILRAAKTGMGEAAWHTWMSQALRQDVISPNVYREVVRRPTVEEAFDK